MTPEEKFIADNRTELALAHYARANESGSQIRGVLLGIATVGVGFVLRKNEPLAEHALSAACFIVSAALVYISWEMQKEKALDRAKLLCQGKSPQTWLAVEKRRLPNYWLDRAAALLILTGMVLEAVLPSE